MQVNVPEKKKVRLFRRKEKELVETGLHFENARVIVDDKPVTLLLDRRKVLAYRANARTGYDVHYLLGTEISPFLIP